MPKLFRVLQIVGITMAALRGAILTALVPLSMMVISVARYLILFGAVFSGAS